MIGVILPAIGGQTGQETKNQLPQELLERRVASDDLEYLTITNAFSRIMSAARAPGGIVSILDCERKEIEYLREPFNSSLRETLEAIVAVAPEYQWHVQEGVINFIPTSGEPALLSTRITELHLENVSTGEALNQLLALPEVKKKQEEIHLSSGFDLGGLQSLRPRRLSLHRQDVTLRQALNAIARAHGHAVWSYREWHCHGKVEFTLKFIVG
jgi:hypothetical protein